MGAIISRELVEDCFEQCEIWEDLDDVIRENYSGRGMYGRECFGLVLNSMSDLLTFFVTLAARDEDAAFELAKSVRLDSMGMSTIYYFPGTELVGI